MLVGLLAFLLFAAAVRLEALPIRPDLKQVLAQPPEHPAQFAPARAGWDGPEMARPPELTPNATLEAIGPAATARAVRASLIAAAIPDYRAVAGIALVILLLRRIRTARRQDAASAHVAIMPRPAGVAPINAADKAIDIERVA